ncbi:MAG: PASTA domain-containing protein [Candidatus Xenobia bacterium]
MKRLAQTLVLLVALGMVAVVSLSFAPDVGDVTRFIHEFQPSARKTGPRPTVVGTDEQAAVSLDNYVGYSAESARRKLHMLGMRVRVQYQISQDLPAGNVLTQAPDANSMVPPGTLVTLVVSRGAGKSGIPDLKGKTQAEAADLLKEAGLTMLVQPQHDMKIPAGTVIKTRPAIGSVLPKGGQVTVLVSAGPYTGHVVPDLVGRSLDDAMTTAGQAGLVLEVLGKHGEDPTEVVKFQKPEAGTEITSGRASIQVRLAPLPVASGSPSGAPSGSPSPAPGARKRPRGVPPEMQ